MFVNGSASDFFLVANSDSDWKVRNGLAEWCDMAGSVSNHHRMNPSTHMKSLPLALCSLAFIALSSCAVVPRYGNSRKVATGRWPVAPDFAEAVKKDPFIEKRFMIKAYQIRHVWGGNEGYPASAFHYRALLTMWSDSSGPVAELFFHDEGQRMPVNPDPRVVKEPPYQIHFPLTMLEPVLHQLRFSKVPVFLSYYSPAGENEWAVGCGDTEGQIGYKP